jgi:hypothetical protein
MKLNLTLAAMGILMATALHAQAPTSKEQADTEFAAAIKKAEADHETAKAKCNGISGQERKVCKSDASTAFDKAKDDAKAAHEKALTAK